MSAHPTGHLERSLSLPVERSLRHHSSTGDYLVALREDLAEWLAGLYPGVEIDADNFFDKLETGTLLCKHINCLIDRLNDCASAGSNESTHKSHSMPVVGDAVKRKINSATMTQHKIQCRVTAQPRSFQARDNLCNCLAWCRSMAMRECLLFESDDLVLRKNEKSVILCVMELARIGAKLGLPAPTLIQFEKEIDEAERRPTANAAADQLDGGELDEIASCSMSSGIFSLGSTSGGDQDPAECHGTETSAGNAHAHMPAYLQNVDQVVKEHVKECCCQTPFPLTKVAPGKYRVGSAQLLIYVRILRNHVMVRVGGGWDTLDHFLEKHDPCRRGHCGCGDSATSVASHKTAANTALTHSAPTCTVPHKTPANANANRRVSTDLTQLQVVYKRELLPHKPADLILPQPAIKSQTTAPTPRRLSKPSLSHTTNPTLIPKLSRARSMDVSVLPEEKSPKPHKSQPISVAKQIVALRPKTANITLRSNPNAKRNRLSMQEGTRGKVPEVPVKPDPWENAMNRHRQKFLQTKHVFEKKVTKEVSSGSDDSAISTPTNPSVLGKRTLDENKRGDSAEEGFFSDTSANSE